MAQTINIHHTLQAAEILYLMVHVLMAGLLHPGTTENVI